MNKKRYAGQKVVLVDSIEHKVLAYLAHRSEHKPGATGFISGLVMNSCCGEFITINGKTAHCSEGSFKVIDSGLRQMFDRVQAQI